MAINYTKIDARLSGQLQSAQSQTTKDITVFVNTITVPDAAQAAVLAQLGVNSASVKTTLFTAQLSVQEIDTLSNYPWIKRLCGSHSLLPLQIPPGDKSN